MAPYPVVKVDPDATMDYIKKSRPDDYPMVLDIVRLIGDAKRTNPPLCESANDKTFAGLHIQWMMQNINHWTPFLATFLGGGGIKPGKTEAFVTFATPYLGQLLEGPIRHHLLTLGYLGGVANRTIETEFENYIWSDSKKKSLKDLHPSLDNAVRNLERYKNLHARLLDWHEAVQGKAGEPKHSISRIRNQIQHAHWFLDIKDDDGFIIFPFLGSQPHSIKKLEIRKWIRNLRIFIHTSSSIGIGIYAGFNKA